LGRNAHFTRACDNELILRNLRVETIALVVTILSTGMVYLDQTALNVAIPQLQRALNADVSGVQWIHNGYMLPLAVLLLIGGALGDRYGRVRMLAIGTAIFVGSSLVCALAPDITWLIAGRALQGVGGALVTPAGLAILNATAPPERKPALLAIWGMFSPLITSLGPVLGGWLTEAVSWRAVFAINLPFGLFTLWLAMRRLPESTDGQTHGPLDVAGLVTLAVGLTGVIYALIEGPVHGWAQPVTLAALLLGLASLVAFVVIESRVADPLIPLRLFRIRAFTGVTLQTLLFYFGLGVIFFFLTLIFQQVLGLSGSAAGLAQLPVPLCLFLMSRVSTRLMQLLGGRTLMVAGTLLVALALFLFTLPTPTDPYLTSWMPIQILFGVGLGGIVIPITSAALAALPTQYSGVASAMNNAASRVAQMLAVAVFGGLLVNGFRVDLSSRLPGLGLDPAAVADVLTRSASLGATTPPVGLDAALTAATQQAIRLSFLEAYHGVLLLGMGIVLSSLIGIALSRPQTR
jgi:EmrB/QacA subfamily drug resistance transporter